MSCPRGPLVLLLVAVLVAGCSSDAPDGDATPDVEASTAPTTSDLSATPDDVFEPTPTVAASDGASDEADTIKSAADVLAASGASDELAECYAEVIGVEGERLESLEDLNEILIGLDPERQLELQRCALEHAN